MDGSRSYAAVCCPGPRATQQRTTSTLEYCVLGQMGDVRLELLARGSHRQAHSFKTIEIRI